MVKADEIRAHAKKQLELYMADPNFLYLKEHAKEIYSQGQTRETKEAALPYYGAIGLEHYEKIVERGDLVAMRRSFSEPYKVRAKRWAEYAGKFRAYLEGDHSVAVDSQVEPEEVRRDIQADAPSEPGTSQSSFEAVLNDAISRAEQRQDRGEQAAKRKEEQLSLF